MVEHSVGRWRRQGGEEAGVQDTGRPSVSPADAKARGDSESSKGDVGMEAHFKA